MTRTLLWAGAAGATRLEIAYVDTAGDALRASGTQVGLEAEPYELRYELEPRALRAEVVGGRSVEVALGGTDFFDLGFSPLFNSLPVLRYDLHRGGEPREFVMTWISVPDLEVRQSAQRYDPLGGDGVVRYQAGDFVADIEFDEDGFVVSYPGLAERVFPPGDELS